MVNFSSIFIASELVGEVLEALLESRQLVLHGAAPDAAGQRVQDHGQQQEVAVQLVPAPLAGEKLVAQAPLLVLAQLCAHLLRRRRLRKRGDATLRHRRLPAPHAQRHHPQTLTKRTKYITKFF